MRLVPFPADQPSPEIEAWTADLDRALEEDASGAPARQWQELRADVRSLAPAMTPEFQQRLRAELELHGALRRAESAAAESIGASPTSGRGESPRSPASRWRAALAVAASLLVLLVAAIALNGRSAKAPSVTGERAPQPAIATTTATARGSQPTLQAPGTPAAAGPAKAPEAESGASAPQSNSVPGVSSASTRVQQLAASITLGTTAADVQSTSDAVAQLASREGGYVQSSNVQVQQHGASEATLSLRLPSAKLSAALAGIGRLAAVRAESQSLQDITNSYDAARQRLSDAVAERRALLRALAAATTEGQIDSLRQRLSESRAAIGRAQTAFKAISQRASTSEIEVTVIGDAHAASEGLTFHRGIHDAGQVLLVALIGLLILLAVAVPLALALFAALSLRRAWRRHQRERVLNGA
jgi:hypothetical protein